MTGAEFCILVVDDDEHVRPVLLRALRRHRWRAEGVPDGESALAVLDELKLDLVIADWRLPGMDGCDVLRRAGERLPGVKKMLITGYPDLEDVRDKLEVGVVLIFKYFQPQQLVEAVESWRVARAPASGITGACSHARAWSPASIRISTGPSRLARVWQRFRTITS